MSNTKPERYVEWKKLLALCIDESIPPHILIPLIKPMQGLSGEQEERHSSGIISMLKTVLEERRSGTENISEP